MSSYPNYHLLDIDDSDFPLTPVLRPCNRHVHETITVTSTQNIDGIIQVEETSSIVQVEEVEEKLVRIIPSPIGIIQLAKIRKQSDIHKGGDDSVLSTQEYMKQVVEDWVYKRHLLKNGKLKQIVAIIKSCSLNALDDLKVTVKDLFGTLPGSLHYKEINEGVMKNVVKVFHKDFVPGNGSDPNYHLLDIDDSNLPLTPVLRPCNRHVHETITITSTQNTNGIVQVEETSGIVQVEEVEEKPVRIIPSPAGIIQLAKIRKQLDIHEGGDDSVLSSQEYMKQVIEDVGEDEDFKSGPWVGATEYVKANGGIVSGCLGDINTFLKNRKLEQTVAIIQSCSLNAFGDLKVTIKDLFGTLPGLIHYKVVNEGVMNNVVKVFHKDFVPSNGSGVGGSRMLMEKEEIVKLVEEEEMAYFELHVYRNVIDQEDLYKFDKEALDLVMEEEARESRAHEEWLEK
nr:hypothetical protein [Tanacetum cinerariifolium]